MSFLDFLALQGYGSLINLRMHWVTVVATGKDEEFVLKLINRPILVLRGAHGFVCYHRNSNLLDANRSIYDVFHLNFSDGAYQVKGN